MSLITRGPYKGKHPNTLIVKCRMCGSIIAKRDCTSWCKYMKIKFCSSRCSNLWNVGQNNHFWKPRSDVRCDICRTPIIYPPNISPSARRRRFCSLDCRRRGLYPHILTSWEGYQAVGYDRKNHAIFDHVIRAERALGMPLPTNAVVHHINGIRGDNRNTNLLVCDRSYHTWLHQEMSRRYMQEHFGDS